MSSIVDGLVAQDPSIELETLAERLGNELEHQTSGFDYPQATYQVGNRKPRDNRIPKLVFNIMPYDDSTF